jgi:hypothetical protein
MCSVKQTMHFTKLNMRKEEGVFNSIKTVILLQFIFITASIIPREAITQAIVPDFQVAAISGPDYPFSPIIGADGKNNFTVIYVMLDMRPHVPRGPIWGQQYSDVGAVQGEGFYVTEYHTTRSIKMDMNDSGNFIVCWEWIGVTFRRFNANCEPLDTTITFGLGRSPDVGIDEAGNFVIAWEQSDTIYCQQYNTEGEVAGNRITVSNNPDGTRSSLPRIGVDSSGNFAIVWQNSGYDFIHSYYQRYNYNSEPQGGNIRVSNDTNDSHQAIPAIDVDKTGNFVIAWMDNRNGDYDIYCQKFNGNGEPQGSSVRVNDDVGIHDQKLPAIAVEEPGQIILTWQDDRNENWDIYGQRYSSSGIKIGNNFIVTEIEEGDQEFPDVSLKNGRIYNTWIAEGVWANVLDFNNPANVNSKEFREEIPSGFKLKQNYPNPFNPATIIKYSLPVDGLVSIKVFDILGKEIAELVNEYNAAGEYSVSFSGPSIASGVYFYAIIATPIGGQAGDFRQVKKMILQK